MKKMIPILILGAATTLFTACHKQESTSASPQPLATAGAANQGYVYNSNIIYQLTVHKSNPSSILVWDDGYMHVSGVVFNPIYTTQGTDRLARTTTSNSIGQPIDVTVPFFGPSVIAAVRMPEIYSQQANVTIQATPKGTTQTLQLNGRFNFAPDMPPYPPHHVVFTVSQPLDLNTQWVQRASIPAGGALAAITMDLGQLANGITYGMMNSATVTGGNTIYISATQNTTIYNIMYANLKAMQLGLMLTPSPETKPSM